MAKKRRTNRILFLLGTIVSTFFTMLIESLIFQLLGEVTLLGPAGFVIVWVLVIFLISHVVAVIVQGLSITLEPFIEMIGHIRLGTLERRKERKLIKIWSKHNIEIEERKHQQNLENLNLNMMKEGDQEIVESIPTNHEVITHTVTPEISFNVEQPAIEAPTQIEQIEEVSNIPEEFVGLSQRQIKKLEKMNAKAALYQAQIEEVVIEEEPTLKEI